MNATIETSETMAVREIETYRVEYNLRAKADEPAWSKNWHLAKTLTGLNAEKAANAYMKSLPMYSRPTARMRVRRVDVPR